MSSIAQQIEKKILEDAIKDIDITKYQKEIDKAVKAYFNEEFVDVLRETLYDEGVGYELAKPLSKKISAQINKLKITLS